MMTKDQKRKRAVAFARALGECMSRKAWAEALRENPQEEHKALANKIQAELQRVVRANEGQVLFDWEGNSARKHAQQHSYDLLGTGAHPDAAVLRPFRCALEFDRQGGTNRRSHFKECLMKAACHVLSGAYDAALIVYLLLPEERAANIFDKKSSCDRRLMTELERAGLMCKFVS